MSWTLSYSGGCVALGHTHCPWYVLSPVLRYNRITLSCTCDWFLLMTCWTFKLGLILWVIVYFYQDNRCTHVERANVNKRLIKKKKKSSPPHPLHGPVFFSGSYHFCLFLEKISPIFLQFLDLETSAPQFGQLLLYVSLIVSPASPLFSLLLALGLPGPSLSFSSLFSC